MDIIQNILDYIEKYPIQFKNEYYKLFYFKGNSYIEVLLKEIIYNQLPLLIEITENSIHKYKIFNVDDIGLYYYSININYNYQFIQNLVLIDYSFKTYLLEQIDKRGREKVYIKYFNILDDILASDMFTERNITKINDNKIKNLLNQI